MKQFRLVAFVALLAAMLLKLKSKLELVQMNYIFDQYNLDQLLE